MFTLWRKVGRRTVCIVAGGLVLLVTLAVASVRADPAGSSVTPRGGNRHHGPWIFGRPNAPFTVVEYADLECPYCRTYFPVLRRWIDAHPQVNWEWWNLPLSMHNPAAFQEAVLAECVGEIDGDQAFWQMVGWIYLHSPRDAAGMAASKWMPGFSPTIRTCINSDSADKVILAQTAQAAREHVAGTPTLRIVNHRTGRSVELQGPAESDALLSAIDWLDTLDSHQRPHATPR